MSRRASPSARPEVAGPLCELPGGEQWSRVESSGSVTVGLTVRGQELVGSVVHFRGPDARRRFRAHEPVASLESSKWVGHLAMPADGEIVETNGAAVADPGLINRDPEGAGWLYRYRPLRGESESANRMGP